MTDTTGVAVPTAREGYSLGYEAAVLELLRRRTLAACLPIVLPHLRPGLAVLDIGCGPGSMTIELAERVAPGPVVGLDIADDQFAGARARAVERGVANVRFECGDAYALPLADASLDLVFTSGLVGHLDTPAQMLAEARRVLKPGGLLALVDNDNATWAIAPAGSALARAMDLLQRVMTHNGGNRLPLRNARGALLAAGFARVEADAVAEVYGTPEATRLAAKVMAAFVAEPGFRRTVLEQGWADAAELEELSAAVHGWGDRPDAFAAVVKCSALGWKPEHAWESDR